MTADLQTTMKKGRRVRVSESAYTVVSDLIRVRCARSALAATLTDDERIKTVHRLLGEIAIELETRMGTHD
nr:hypothetical protein [uncultured Lichenicoccus sp.]